MTTDTKLKNAIDDLERTMSRARRGLANGLQNLIAEEEDAQEEIDAFDATVATALADFRKATGQLRAD
jgi:hypothetical protein